MPRLAKAATVLAVAALATVWHPVTQCLALNLIDPWFTMTMVSEAVEHARKERELAWPDYRPMPIESLGPHLPRAAMTAEDQKFLEHHGFDLEAIAAAWEAYGQPGKPLKGGSTISQQVARNVFLWQGRTWIRKGLEAWYTVWLELLVPKRRILELYLNVAETGPMVFGFEAGAQHWFGEPAAELSATEAATLVVLLPAPSSRTPKSRFVQRRAAWVVRNRVPLPEL